MKKLVLAVLVIVTGTERTVAQQITNVYYDVVAANGNGVRFWQNDNWKIHMGNLPEYHYGPVTDYSIKMNMDATAGRGWTWGAPGGTPVAALGNQGNMQIAGSFTTAGNVKIFAIDQPWAEGVTVVKPSGWGGLRLTRNDPAGNNYNGNWAVGYNANTGNDFSISTNNNGTQYDGIFHISNSTRNVGIGTTSPDAKLAVSGQVHAQEVKVSITVPGPDYVFNKDYKLASLEEIKNYIDQNKHLPEVPSAKEMEKNGVQLGEMNMLLLKKIEELTLHMIELKKENENQRLAIEKLNDQILKK